MHKVVFEMYRDSAADPNVFTGKFFQVTWVIVASDIYEAALSFFCGADIRRIITSMLIVILIPKTSNPHTILFH